MDMCVNMDEQLYKIVEYATMGKKLKSKGIVCAGRDLFIPLVDTELIAKIEFMPGAVRTEYNGVQVTIVNKKIGPIEKMQFKFNDFLSNKQAFYISYIEIVDDQAKWIRMLTFEERRKMADSIRNYISLFE